MIHCLFSCRWAEDSSLVEECVSSCSYTNWAMNEPNGLENSNCMYMDSYDGTWWDYSCDYPDYAVCSKPIASTSAAAAAHNITAA